MFALTATCRMAPSVENNPKMEMGLPPRTPTFYAFPMRRQIKLTFAAFVLVVAGIGVWLAKQRQPRDYQLLPDGPLKEAIAVATRPGWETDFSGPGCQTGQRLALMIFPQSEALYYQPKPEDLPFWKSLMHDRRAGNYARQCACYFLLDTDAEARAFLTHEVREKDPRRRFNAATVLNLYMREKFRGGENSKPPQWAIDLTILLLADGSVDHIKTEEAKYGIPEGEGVERDSADILATPIWDLCDVMRWIKEAKAVDALIAVLQRDPKNPSAASALGDIGDAKAIPILLTILKDENGYDHSEVTALGHLRCREAVPFLVAKLGHPKSTFSGLDVLETQYLLEALRDIGDKNAIDPIKAFILVSDSPKKTTAAKRVLAQLEQDDAVPALLTLLRGEGTGAGRKPGPESQIGPLSDFLQPAGDETEQAAIMQDLSRYLDERVIREFAGMARTSESAFLRRTAIIRLANPKFPEAVKELALLLDVRFPDNLKTTWGWRGRPKDINKELHEGVVTLLKSLTKQDLGDEAGPWLEWLKSHPLPVPN